MKIRISYRQTDAHLDKSIWHNLKKILAHLLVPEHPHHLLPTENILSSGSEAQCLTLVFRSITSFSGVGSRQGRR